MSDPLAPMTPPDRDQVYIDVTPDPIGKLKIEIRNTIKATGHRGEPSPELVEALLKLQLHGQATSLRKASRLVNDYADREKVRDLADDLDPYLS